MTIVHHRNNHRNLSWCPIPQPWQTGSPRGGGGGYRAGEVLRKRTRGNYGKRVSRTTQKTAHRALYLPQSSPGKALPHNLLRGIQGKQGWDTDAMLR